jgi:hypothetical protein
VRGVIDIGMGIQMGLVSQKAQISIRNRVVIEPFDGIGDSYSVSPVCVEAMGDKSNPNPSVGKTPERFRCARDDRHCSEHAVLYNRQSVEPFELHSVHAPFGEVPSLLRRQGGQIDSSFLGDDSPERFGVITAYSIEINSEDEVRHCQ